MSLRHSTIITTREQQLIILHKLLLNFACLGTETIHELSGDGVRGGAPAENGFSVILSPQIASDDSKLFTCHLCPEKWGYGTPSPKVGVLIPLVRYAYEVHHEIKRRLCKIIATNQCCCHRDHGLGLEWSRGQICRSWSWS